MALKPIQLKNTLSGTKEVFVPIQTHHVTMYNCGPTVYDYAHIGNMRSYMLADLLRRTLEAHGYLVQQVINVTDVGHIVADADTGEDKVEKAAREKKQTVQEITEHYLHAFIEDLRALHMHTHRTMFPHASDHIPEQIALIQTLEKKGYTYTTSDGVYFDTSKFKEYGKLGNINLAGLEEGARIGVNNEKKNITDFALWKFSRPEEKRQQEWPSPWGIGFPGWHIECSAMSMKYLGETFDIHTGGIDHIPVHHNNEIAQSECATGKQYVHYWLHNAFIRVNDQKMSKSLGNIITLADVVKKGIPPLAIRYWFFGARYSTQMNFTWEALADAENAREKLEKWFQIETFEDGTFNENYWHDFLNALGDDLDSPRALSILWEVVKSETISESDKRATVRMMNGVLQIIHETAKEFSPEIKALISEREQARVSKDWKKSDELRKELESKGVKVEDGKEASRYI